MPEVHQRPEREPEHDSRRARTASGRASSAAASAGEDAAAAPGQHLPRRVRALAEEEVRRERGERTDREAAARSERDARRGDDHRHRLHARDRREEHTAGGGDAAERGDEREVAGRAGAVLEPGGARRDDRDGGEEHRDRRRGTGRARPRRRRRARRATQATSDPTRQRAPPPGAERHPAVRGEAAVVRGDEHAAPAPPRTGAASRRARAFRSGSIPRVGSSRTRRSGSATVTAANAEPLALAAREVARMPLGRPAQPDHVERRARARLVTADRRARPRRARARRPDSGPDPARGSRAARARATVPASGLEQPGGELRERRLAGAVRPFERHDLAAADGERRAARPRARPRRRRRRPRARRPRGRELCGGRRVGQRPPAYRGRSLGEPGERLVDAARREEAAPLDEQHAVGERERPAVRCSERTTAARRAPRRLRGTLGAVGVELRRRLVQEQELRAGARARTRGRRAGARRPRARRAPLREVRARRRPRAPRRRAARSRRRRPDVLEPERDLVADARHHDLVLRVLEDGRHGARRGRPGRARPRVEARRPRPGPRTGRRESAGRAPRARAGASTCPSPDGPSSATNSPALELERHVASAAPPRPDTRTSGRSTRR